MYAEPTGVPTRLQSVVINSSTLLFSWNVPNAKFHSANKTVKRFIVEVIAIENSTLSRVKRIYTTENTHLLVNMKANSHYMLRVAAYTKDLGPFAQITAVSPQGILILLV